MDRVSTTRIPNVPEDPDVLLRIALVTMAADGLSTLTTGERAYIIDLGRRTDRLTREERLAYKERLLEWAQVMLPRCYPMIADDLGGEE